MGNSLRPKIALKLPKTVRVKEIILCLRNLTNAFKLYLLLAFQANQEKQMHWKTHLSHCILNTFEQRGVRSYSSRHGVLLPRLGLRLFKLSHGQVVECTTIRLKVRCFKEPLIKPYRGCLYLIRGSLTGSANTPSQTRRDYLYLQTKSLPY